jgi:hypothetical protein
VYSEKIRPSVTSSCLSQIPHDLTWDRSRAAVVRSQRLTALAMELLVLAPYLGQHLMKILFRPFVTATCKDVSICRLQLLKWEQFITVTDLTPLLHLTASYSDVQSRVQRTAITTIAFLAKRWLLPCPESHCCS